MTEKRICWKDGMEVTHKVFQQADRYQQYMYGEILRIVAANRNGLLNSNYEITDKDGCIIVEICNVKAVASDGTVFDIENVIEKIVKSNDGFIILRSEKPQERMENEIPCMIPQYVIDLSEQVNEGSVILGRVNGGKLQESYIPTCYFVDSHRGLEEMYKKSLVITRAISKKLKKNTLQNEACLFDILLMELEDYGHICENSPHFFFVLLRKMVFSLSKIAPQNSKVPPLPTLSDFNSYDIRDCMNPMLNYLNGYNIGLDEVVVQEQPKIEEKKPSEYYEFIID